MLVISCAQRYKQPGWGNRYCSIKWFCVLGWLAAADLIKWKCCNSELFGPNLKHFTWVQIPGNGSCLVLSGRVLNKSPQDNHTTIINQRRSSSLSLFLLLHFPFANQLAYCHSHLASTLAPVVSWSWFCSLLPNASLRCDWIHISDIQLLLNLTGPCFVSLTGQ